MLVVGLVEPTVELCILDYVSTWFDKCLLSNGNKHAYTSTQSNSVPKRVGLNCRGSHAALESTNMSRKAYMLSLKNPDGMRDLFGGKKIKSSKGLITPVHHVHAMNHRSCSALQALSVSEG